MRHAVIFATQWQDHETIKQVGFQDNGAIQNNQKSMDKEL